MQPLILKISILMLLVTMTQAGIAAMNNDEYESSNGANSAGSPLARVLIQVRKNLALSEFDEAANKLSAVVKEHPEHVNAWNLLGFAERNRGDFAESASAYEQALRLDPNHRSALQYQGELFVSLGNLDAARLNLMKLITLCPTGCKQRTRLAEVLNSVD